MKLLEGSGIIIISYQVNSFVYCQRKWYYQNRLKFFLEDDNIEYGKYIHQTHWLSVKCRKEVYLTSDKWKLKGICDYLIEENRKEIPLEIKSGKCKGNTPYEPDIMQLMCYILLLEDNFSIKYEYGYILYVGSKKKLKVTIDRKMRSNLYSYFKSIRAFMRSGVIPRIKKDEKSCWKCSYHDCCWSE